jgi:hypothetical protein
MGLSITLTISELAKSADFMDRWNNKHSSRKIKIEDAVKIIFQDGLRELEEEHLDLYQYADEPTNIKLVSDQLSVDAELLK